MSNEEVKNEEATTEEVTTEETTSEETTSEEATEATEESGLDFKWYIAKTLTGQENKIERALKERVVNFKMTEFFQDILVPEEQVISHSGGKKRTIKRKLFPGYILIKMVMNDNTWHLVKDTDKITGFVGGTPEKPAPISDAEAAYMTNQAEEGFAKPKISVNFEEGESVKVTEGPFASFVGKVEAVNENGKLKVNVSIFGRPTPVELDSSQVEKID